MSIIRIHMILDMQHLLFAIDTCNAHCYYYEIIQLEQSFGEGAANASFIELIVERLGALGSFPPLSPILLSRSFMILLLQYNYDKEINTDIEAAGIILFIRT